MPAPLPQPKLSTHPLAGDFMLSAQYKSFPLAEAGTGASADTPASSLGARGWHLLHDDLPYPLAVIQRSALQHNLRWMQDFAQRKGVHLAPHGKTTMSPELFAMQLQAGAWGLTFATIYQLGIGVAAGARRCIIANQVLGPADLRGLHALLSAHADLRVWFLVDSLAQLRLIEAWCATHAPARVFDVLLEMGIAGKRTGCRSQEEALTLAYAIAASPAVRLCGVECYEGSAAQCDIAHDTREVSALVRRILAVTQACDNAQLFADAHILLTAGGSGVFDLVVPLLQTRGLSRPVHGVLRSGCYITHDHTHYRQLLQLVEQREGLSSSLQPALEVWALVQSVPEPGLALLSCGRRDISYDMGLPTAQRYAPRGVQTLQDASAAPADWRITALNDQHAYLQFDPQGTVPAVGDRVALGISHPCTTFDKWRWLALMEDDGAISGAVRTCF